MLFLEPKTAKFSEREMASEVVNKVWVLWDVGGLHSGLH